jgi:hypothetical protein
MTSQENCKATLGSLKKPRKVVCLYSLYQCEINPIKLTVPMQLVKLEDALILGKCVNLSPV